MMREMGKILVTGAAGFIGFHLARALLTRGYDVVGADSMNDYYDPALKAARLAVLKDFSAFSFERCDLAEKKAVDRLLREKPKAVVHLAAQAGVRYSIDHPEEYITSNIQGFFNVLEACRRHLVWHLVFASSSSVYGNQKKTPFSVTDNVDYPISLYAATKRADELMAHVYSHLYGIPTTGLRFFTVYGPFGRPDMAYFKFADAIFRGEPIKIYNHGDMLRDFTYIDDVVTAVVKVLEKPPKSDGGVAPYRIYNIGGSRPERLTDFISELESALGKTAKRKYLPMQPGDVYATCADVSDLVRDFGFIPSVTIREGLKKFADWYLDFYAARIGS